MTQFRPMQASNVDFDYFMQQRNLYSLEEWTNLLIRTMGYSEDRYDKRQQRVLLTRLIPIVEPRVNLILKQA
jgi:ATP-dependent Lon protease